MFGKLCSRIGLTDGAVGPNRVRLEWFVPAKVDLVGKTQGQDQVQINDPSEGAAIKSAPGQRAPSWIAAGADALFLESNPMWVAMGPLENSIAGTDVVSQADHIHTVRIMQPSQD